MKFDSGDVRKIICSAIFFISAIFVSGSVFLALNSKKSSALEEFGLARGNLKQLEHTLIRSRSDETTIKMFAELFLRLDARGFFAKEDRLTSVELLESIRSKRKLIALAYEFGPQISLNAAPENGVTFLSTPSHFEISLLHEEDLIHFFDDLRHQAKALIRVRNCEISRLSNDEFEAITQGKLRADCHVDWITFRKHSEDRTMK